jgi:FAD/FMN-containing dehydrogenase
VVPGTRWVSLGGAVANDVDGKNHHRFGSFGCHVPGFTLLRTGGRMVVCSPEDNAELYRATIGGLGLTGLILDLKLQLRRVPGLTLVAEDLRMGSLDEFYALSAESESGWEYSVAWVDCLARGSAVGRGIFSRANHVPGPVGPTHRYGRASPCRWRRLSRC